MAECQHACCLALLDLMAPKVPSRLDTCTIRTNGTVTQLKVANIKNLICLFCFVFQALKSYATYR